MFKIEMLIRKIIHRLIIRYLLNCGGAFHSKPYGEHGLYVALMNEKVYGEYTKIDRSRRVY